MQTVVFYFCFVLQHEGIFGGYPASVVAEKRECFLFDMHLLDFELEA